MGAADVLLVERRLRSGSRGVKRLSEREPSPIARRLRTHRGTAGLGVEKRFRRSSSPGQISKRRKVRPQNVDKSTESKVIGLVARRVQGSTRSKQPVGERRPAKRLLQTSPSPIQRSKRRKVVPQANSAQAGDLGDATLVERAAWRSGGRRRIQATSMAPPTASTAPLPSFLGKTSKPHIPQKPIQTLPDPLIQTPPDSAATPPISSARGAIVCHSCRARFTSYEALEYHQNLKMRALQKCRILAERFSADLHLAVCPIKTCCSSFDTVEKMRQHLILHHRLAGKAHLTGRDRTLESLNVVFKHSPTEEGIISCPACLTTFNSKNNLTRHQNNSCRGYGQYNCIVCSKYCQDRKQMLNHMKSAHPPPSGLTISGMFAGSQKERKGDRSERSIGGRDLLTQYTFVPQEPIVTSASEFFDNGRTEGLVWLIQRARSSGGNSIARVNVSTLLRRGQARSLIPFQTQARLIVFSASDTLQSVIDRLSISITIDHQGAASLGAARDYAS